MDEAAREQLLDKRIQRRLATDAAYRNAENAEDQSAREWAIEREEEDRLDRERAVARDERREREWLQRQEFAAAHAEGFHAELPREGCPECEA